MNLEQWRSDNKDKDIDYRLSLRQHQDSKCKWVDIEVNKEKWLSIKIDQNGDLVILFNDKAKNPLLNPHKFESLTEIKVKKQDNLIFNSSNDLQIEQIKVTEGMVEHLTFHPETNEISKEDQELHLYLNGDKKGEPTGKIKSYPLTKNNNGTNLLFYLYVSNSELTGNDSSENSTIIAVGNYLDELNDLIVQMDLTGNSGSSQLIFAPNLEIKNAANNRVKFEILNDNTYLVVKNNMPSIEIMSNSNDLFYQNVDGFNLSYLKFCYQECEKNNHNGFLVLGNPKYAVENKESLYVSYLK